jgi:hypothetical protein
MLSGRAHAYRLAARKEVPGSSLKFILFAVWVESTKSAPSGGIDTPAVTSHNWENQAN